MISRNHTQLRASGHITDLALLQSHHTPRPHQPLMHRTLRGSALMPNQTIRHTRFDSACSAHRQTCNRIGRSKESIVGKPSVEQEASVWTARDTRLGTRFVWDNPEFVWDNPASLPADNAAPRLLQPDYQYTPNLKKAMPSMTLLNESDAGPGSHIWVTVPLKTDQTGHDRGVCAKRDCGEVSRSPA